jgi:hypothetical protein
MPHNPVKRKENLCRPEERGEAQSLQPIFPEILSINGAEDS